jgi:membrane-associated protease RseP (regulator of RpoE activity)
MLHTPGPQRGPMSSTERWTYGIFLVVMLGLFAGEVATNYQPVKLSVLLFLLFWGPLLALHELGHAAAAAIVGWRVQQIVIGMGRPVGAYRLGSAILEIRLLPLEGFCRSVPQNLVLPGLKHAFIYSAGPGIELLLAAGILLMFGPGQLFSHSDDVRVIAWQSLAAAATVGGVLNLIPHAVQSSNGFIPNDGLGILLSLSRPASAYATLLGSPNENEIES